MKKCYRCGQDIQPSRWPKLVRIEKLEGLYGYFPVDLCRECQSLVSRFIAPPQYVTVDGEKLEYDSSISTTINLDKIDISRELYLLRKKAEEDLNNR